MALAHRTAITRTRLRHRLIGADACRTRAISLVEVMVVIGILAVVSGLMVPVISRARRSARSAHCLTNLHSIGTALRLYAELGTDQYPAPGGEGVQWEDLLSPYITSREIYACPDDTELFVTLGSSYDWRDTGDPKTTLSGRAVSVTNRSDAVLVFDSLPGWHQRGLMNAVLLDGSGLSMPEDTCLGDLLKPVSR